MSLPSSATVAMPTRVGRRGGFTLVELMVVMIILSILASLSLAGLAGARTRSKIDKTKSTIRKIHEIVIPHYESFAEKRVAGPRFAAGAPTAAVGASLPIYTVWIDNSATPPRAWINDTPGAAWVGPSTNTRKTIAEGRLKTLRVMQLLDLPDQWADVDCSSVAGVQKLMSAAARRYQQFRASKPAMDQWESAECLAMIVMRGGFAGDATENFRTDELGDVNANGCPEFLDAWGQPIQFIRWPVGYTINNPVYPVTRTLQTGDKDTDHDPLDPMKVASNDYRVIPLIYSGGPDGNGLDPTSMDNSQNWYGIRATGNYIGDGWIPPLGPGVASTIPPPPQNVTEPEKLPGSVFDRRTYSDSITNHDLITK
ncbi:MAG: type II secretion system protein [Planctomycetota bacterium]